MHASAGAGPRCRKSSLCSLSSRLALLHLLRQVGGNADDAMCWPTYTTCSQQTVPAGAISPSLSLFPSPSLSFSLYHSPLCFSLTLAHSLSPLSTSLSHSPLSLPFSFSISLIFFLPSLYFSSLSLSLSSLYLSFSLSTNNFENLTF